MKYVVLFLGLFLAPIVAKDSPLALITSSPVAVTTRTSDIYSIYLANTSGSATSCTLTTGDSLQFWPTISIAANTVYALSFSEKRTIVTAVNGFTVSCATTNVVLGQFGYTER